MNGEDGPKTQSQVSMKNIHVQLIEFKVILETRDYGIRANIVLQIIMKKW